MQRSAGETKTVKGFTDNNALKRVTTPAGSAAVGVKTLSFRPKKPSRHAQYPTAPTRPPKHDMGAAFAEALPTTGSPATQFLPSTQPKSKAITTKDGNGAGLDGYCKTRSKSQIH
jgi:hypothetical protein